MEDDKLGASRPRRRKTSISASGRVPNEITGGLHAARMERSAIGDGRSRIPPRSRYLALDGTGELCEQLVGGVGDLLDRGLELLGVDQPRRRVDPHEQIAVPVEPDFHVIV